MNKLNDTISHKQKKYLNKFIKKSNDLDDYYFYVDKWLKTLNSFKFFLKNSEIDYKLNDFILERIEDANFQNIENKIKISFQDANSDLTDFSIISAFLSLLQFKKEKAEEHLEEALRINKKPYNFIIIADINFELEEFDRCIEIYEKALSHYFNDNKSESFLALLYKKKALVWYEIGDFKKAEKNCFKAVELDIKKYGSKSTVVAEDLYMLSNFCYKTKKYLKSCNLLEEAIKIDQLHYDIYHPDFAKKFSKLGNSYLAMKKYKEALSYYEKAFSINKRVYGFENVNTVISLNRLAYLMKRLKKYEVSLNLYEKVIKIEEKLYGSKHYKIALTLNNMASVWSVLKGYIKAENLYDKAENILISSLGSNHPYTKKTTYNKYLLEKKWGRTVNRTGRAYN